MKTNVFFAEMTPCEHAVHFYENDELFLNLLAEFALQGFRAGDCVILIITPNHLTEINNRLTAANIDIESLTRSKQYICLDAEDALLKFMRNDRPDKGHFTEFVRWLLKEARQQNRQVRAFGEMVALLWVKRNYQATIELETLWHEAYEKERFNLFCAYPRAGFTENMSQSIRTICAVHSKLIDTEAL
jgi:hypothetical protein